MITSSTEVFHANSFDALVDLVRRCGYSSGPPVGYPVGSAMVDADTAGDMKCGGCGRVGLAVTHFHFGSKCRCIASCIWCDFATEL
jgi:hypothetical protein